RLAVRVRPAAPGLLEATRSIQSERGLVAGRHLEQELARSGRARERDDRLDERTPDAFATPLWARPHRDQPAVAVVLDIRAHDADGVLPVPREEHRLAVTLCGSSRPVDPPLVGPNARFLESRLERRRRVGERAEPDVPQSFPLLGTHTPYVRQAGDVAAVFRQLVGRLNLSHRVDFGSLARSN